MMTLSLGLLFFFFPLSYPQKSKKVLLKKKKVAIGLRFSLLASKLDTRIGAGFFIGRYLVKFGRRFRPKAVCVAYYLGMLGRVTRP